MLQSWHATMYKFVISMVLSGLSMQQYAMHIATIQKTTFFELGVYKLSDGGISSNLISSLSLVNGYLSTPQKMDKLLSEKMTAIAPVLL